MLYFDFKGLFKARNITNPYGLLLQNGFSKSVAYNIANGQMQSIKLKHLYKICRLCNCTPNDVIRYSPSDRDTLSEKHVLNQIKGDALPANAAEVLQALSLQELSAFANLIKEKKEMV